MNAAQLTISSFTCTPISRPPAGRERGRENEVNRKSREKEQKKTY
jgi:hypothetical protein